AAELCQVPASVQAGRPGAGERWRRLARTIAWATQRGPLPVPVPAAVAAERALSPADGVPAVRRTVPAAAGRSAAGWSGRGAAGELGRSGRGSSLGSGRAWGG